MAEKTWLRILELNIQQNECQLQLQRSMVQRTEEYLDAQKSLFAVLQQQLKEQTDAVSAMQRILSSSSLDSIDDATAQHAAGAAASDTNRTAASIWRSVATLGQLSPANSTLTGSARITQTTSPSDSSAIDSKKRKVASETSKAAKVIEKRLYCFVSTNDLQMNVYPNVLLFFLTEKEDNHYWYCYQREEAKSD